MDEEGGRKGEARGKVQRRITIHNSLDLELTMDNSKFIIVEKVDFFVFW